GATMAFGMLYPRRREAFDGDRENKYRTYAMVQQLRKRYLDAYGGLTCHDVHRTVLGRPFDLRDPDQREAFEAAGAHADKCTGVVKQAAEWAMEIIGEERRRSRDQAQDLHQGHLRPPPGNPPPEGAPPVTILEIVNLL
ncbi:MAG: C-GCAxxG-C-C family protein, partial [Anaerolineae bacterium]